MQDHNNIVKLEDGLSNTTNAQSSTNNTKDNEYGQLWINEELVDVHYKREMAIAKYKQNKTEENKKTFCALNDLYKTMFSKEVTQRINENKHDIQTWMSDELKDCYKKRDIAITTFCEYQTKKNKNEKSSWNAIFFKKLKFEVTNRIKRSLLLYIPIDTSEETISTTADTTANTSHQQDVPEPTEVPPKQMNIEHTEQQWYAKTWTEKPQPNVTSTMTPSYIKPWRPAGIPRTLINQYSEMSAGASIPTLVRRPVTSSKNLKAEQTPINMSQPQPLSSLMGVAIDPSNLHGANLPAYYTPQPTCVIPHHTQMYVNTDTSNMNQSQMYSPSQISMGLSDQNVEPSIESQGQYDASQKRPSAFDRLGPRAKQPKLTINVMNKDETIRQVVEAEVPKPIPFHERENVINSTDEIVLKYLPFWPWKEHVQIRKSVDPRSAKSVMLLEREQNDIFGKENNFILVTITGYPPTWTKENVLDELRKHLNEKSLIPCFINFTKEECKFFVKNNKSALLEIRARGYIIRYKRNTKLSINIDFPIVNLPNFIPNLVVKKRISAGYDGCTKLDLREFTLQEDVSHFIYFPLSNIHNQRELVLLAIDVVWRNLTELDLSHNRLRNLDGFNLPFHTPKLKSLDISNNWIQSLPSLISCRNLPLHSLKLEGNPLCHDYIDESLYTEVVKTLFPNLKELDGEKLILTGQMPEFRKNYCPIDAIPVVEKFLETFFPLLNAYENDRDYISNMYDKNALLTITYKSKLRYNADHKKVQALLFKGRNFDQKIFDCVKGSSNIGKIITKWPQMLHDHTTFTVDVLYHTEDTTTFKVTGILKLVAESLAEDEPILMFSRTVCLVTSDGVEYKIKNEMLYWDQPTQDYAKSAFKLAGIQSKPKLLDLKFETTPDEKTQELLVIAFMDITQLEEKASRRCLQMKEWHFKNALEYFSKLLKYNNTEILFKTE